MLDVVESEQLLAKALARGQELRTELKAELDSHPNVGEIRGRGLPVSIEFVADCSRLPLDTEPQTPG